MALKAQTLQALVVSLFTVQCVHNCVCVCKRVFPPMDHSKCQWCKWRVRVFQTCGLPAVDSIKVCVRMCLWVEVKRVLLSLSSAVTFTADACLHLCSAERATQLLSGWNVHRCWHRSVNTTGLAVQKEGLCQGGEVCENAAAADRDDTTQTVSFILFYIYSSAHSHLATACHRAA